MICKACKREIPDNSIYCNMCGTRLVRKKQDISVPTPRLLPSGKWNIQLRAEKKSITEDTAELCIAKAKSIRAGFVDIKKEPLNITFSEAFERYISDREYILSPATIREYTRIKDKDFRSLSNIKIKDVTQEVLQRAVNELSKNISAKTLRSRYSAVNSVLNVYLPSVKFNISLPAPQKPKVKIPTSEDMKRILELSENTSLELPVLLAAFGSLRRGEICALTKDDITDSGVIVNKALVKDKDRKWVVKSTKTPDSVREATLPDIVIQKLRKVDKISTITPDTITAMFYSLMKKNGLPNYHFHSLRHFWASTVHALGIPDYYLVQNGGWKNMSMPNKTYLHSLDENKEFRKIINSNFEALAKR